MTLSFNKENVTKRKFVEKIWQSIYMDNPETTEFQETLNKGFDIRFHDVYKPKKHTIREDEKNRWKADNKIHFVINNRTKDRFQFAPICKVKSTQKLSIIYDGTKFPVDIYIDDELYWSLSYRLEEWIVVEFKDVYFLDFIQNDGFDDIDDFFMWLPEGYFVGKIIHWTDLRY